MTVPNHNTTKNHTVDNLVEGLLQNTSEQSVHLYKHFNQVKNVIQGVEAIDYFFAKEMLNALVFERNIDVVELANLTHLLLALSASLRAGHSCLPLTAIANQHWGKGYPVKDKVNHESPHFTASKDCKNDAIEIELSHVGFIFAPKPILQTMLKQLDILPGDNQLLVFKDDNIYLRRYFQFETDLGQYINSRLAQTSQFDTHAISQCIDTLFPIEPTDKNQSMQQEEVLDWQKIAAANAINKNFSVIAGGPGTGKTYTVTKLLAALVMLKQSADTLDDAPLNIALVAPTGKAAQRLSESIVDAIDGFKGAIEDCVLANIPTQAQTIHRLLGVIPNSPNFKHNEDNLLNVDVILIDEVSMVDLPLMTRIFRALKPTTKVILLGDADQLPSVATGSVLADIAPRIHSGYSAENAQYLSDICQYSEKSISYAFSNIQTSDKDSLANAKNKETPFDYLTFLIKSRRFDGKGGIGLLAKSVIQGDKSSSWLLLNQSQSKEDSKTEINNQAELDNQPELDNDEEQRVVPAASQQLTLAQGELSDWLVPLVKQYYQPIESSSTVKEAFALLAKFRVLCATRQGEFGVEQLNELIKGYLGKNTAPHLQRQGEQQKLYHGQPIMINENDYRLGLYNGDVGIIWRIKDQTGKLHLLACFEDSSSKGNSPQESSSIETLNHEDNSVGIRHILPSRLPSYESVYAMTIHKTQGSEFSHVAMVISSTQTSQAVQNKSQQSISKILSRELLYTGITRAKKHLTIAANQRVWQQGVTAQVKRYSGLRLSSMTER